MGNCLVTKLKGVVNNPNLLKLNEFRFNASAFRIESVNDQMEFSILSDNTFTDGTKTKVAQSISEHDLAEAKKTTISVNNKWNIIYLLTRVPNGEEMDLTSLSFSQNLGSIYIMGGYASTILKGAKGLIYGKNIFSLNFEAIMLEGKPTLADLIPKVNNKIITFGIRNMASTCMSHVPDELTELAKLTACTNYDWWTDDLDGDIEEFVAASRAYGRTTGTINVNTNSYTHIRFQGQPVTGKVNPSEPDLVLSWTENTITWNGVTINA